MRLWPTLLLGSTLLFLVTAYLHFFNPSLKQDLKSRRTVTYKSFNTLNTDEVVTREKIKNRITKRREGFSPKSQDLLAQKISKVSQEFYKGCEKGVSYFESHPDYIDPQSKHFRNPYQARDKLNDSIGLFFSSISILSNAREDLERSLSLISEEIKFGQYQNYLIEYEEIIHNCGLSDVAAPVMMSFAEVVSRKNDLRLKNMMVEMFVRFAWTTFTARTFSSYEIGLGILRNMNSFNVLSIKETEDLINLSERVSLTYENYRREVGRKAQSVAEAEEAFFYYQVERELLYELLEEYVNNLNAAYPAY